MPHPLRNFRHRADAAYFSNSLVGEISFDMLIWKPLVKVNVQRPFQRRESPRSPFGPRGQVWEETPRWATVGP